MTSELWAEIEKLYGELADLPPSERQARLSATPDEELRGEVASLLAAGSLATEVSGAIRETGAAAAQPALQRFGPWQTTGVIGQGGMGAVFTGVRADHAFDKQVAIKVLHLGLDNQAARERFQQERGILAGLEHPNIARLLDGGETASGLSYFVLEYVDGESVVEYCESRKLGREERVRLFLQVCAAVQYAHRNLIVHRDLKPANILVPREGVPKLLDFGIAKLMEPGALQTITGFQALTPQYASPEQMRGQTVTTATDVYSLGMVLYEMLTGRRAYEVDTTSVSEIARTVCEVEPAPPGLGDELDHVILMALRKEPERRYVSVERFAEDIERYLDHRPVSARPDTIRYRAKKFVRRNWWQIAAIATVILSLGAGLGAALYEGRIAQARFQDVRSLANTFLFDLDKEIAPVPGTTKARELLAATARKYLDNLARTAGDDEGLLLELATSYEKLGDVQGVPGHVNLGFSREAADSYRKAIAILERLSRKNPKYRARLAMDLGVSGRIAGESNRTELALELAGRAADISGQISAESPANEELARNAARAFDLLSSIQQGSYRAEAAIQSSRRAVALYEKLTPANSPPQAFHQIAVALQRVALEDRNLSELDAAETAGRRALDLEAGILRRNPVATTSRVLFGNIQETLATLEYSDRYPSRDNADKAIALWREAAGVYSQIARADQNDIRAQVYWALSGASLALAHLGRNAPGDTFLAGQYSESAANGLEAVLRKTPHSGFALSRQPLIDFARAMALSRQDRCPEALRESQRGLEAERAFVSQSNFTADNRLDFAGQLLRHAQVLIRCGEREKAAAASGEAAALFSGLDREMHRWIAYAYQAGAYRMALAREMEAVGRESSNTALLRDAAANYTEAAGFWSAWEPGRPHIRQRVAEASAGRDRCPNR